MTARIHKFLQARYRDWYGKLALQVTEIKHAYDKDGNFEYLQIGRDVAFFLLDSADPNDADKKTLCSTHCPLTAGAGSPTGRTIPTRMR